MPRKVLIVGATSAIAAATASLFAQQGDELFLVARNIDRLHSLTFDLNTRYRRNFQSLAIDFADFNKHQLILQAAKKAMHGIDIALICHGVLPDQAACEKNIEPVIEAFNINCLSVISICNLLADEFVLHQAGQIAVVSSVAADRGRGSNYIYGATKAGLTTYLNGLRNRLHKDKVHVLTIKPGFIDTPMTTEFKKGVLWSTPEKIAPLIMHAIKVRDNEIYVPKFWFFIMMVIKFIPESIFKRMRL